MPEVDLPAEYHCNYCDARHEGLCPTHRQHLRAAGLHAGFDEAPVHKAAVAVKEIMVEQCEGFSHDCVAKTFDSWAGAERHLLDICWRAPADGNSYLKTDFKITWADGQTYSGRYDAYKLLTPSHEGTLSQHIVQHCRFISGQWKPFHLSDEQYKMILSRAEKYTPGISETMKTLLTQYDLGDFQP